MRRFTIVVAAAVVVGGCAARTPPPDQVNIVAAPQQASPQTQAFFQSAVSNHLFVMQSAELALQRSRNPAVHNYAQALYNDHSQMLNRANGAAQAAKANVSPMLQQQHFGLLSQLQTVSPAQFDETFRNTQVMSHLQAIELHQQYLISGDDAAARGLSAEALPGLQANLASGQSLSIVAPPKYRGRLHPGERG